MTFEYMLIDLGTATARVPDVALLNAAGAQGWELVQIVPPNRAFLKRAIPAPTPAKQGRAKAATAV